MGQPDSRWIVGSKPFNGCKVYYGVLSEESEIEAMTSSQACQMRYQFDQYLHANDIADAQVPLPLWLGGVTGRKDQLVDLLIAHGVFAGRSSDCAEHLMLSLGSHAIQQVLQSPRPWQDLKARANMNKPPIKIVMADELRTMINKRAAEPKPVGKKGNKMKPNERSKPFEIKAEQLAIPPGVFKQDDGKELCQIHAHQLGSHCQGVILTNIQEAMPYFELKQPISQEGIALLIVDADDQRLPKNATKSRVPVHCKSTQEPAIVDVAIIQLGTKMVSRNVPSQRIEVQQVATRVIRITVYKDQWPKDWQSIINGPVKTIMKDSPFSPALTSQEILDVCDRQFLSLKLQKVQPSESDLFSVNLRVHEEIAQQLMKINATEGCYAEPRSEDGRQPNPAFAAIWLPGKSAAEAQLAQQMSSAPAVTVRSGTRYGIRVDQSHAEEVHATLRPDLVFLHGSELRRYRTGPWPFGSTKQSIASVFAKFKWSARPVAPVGQVQGAGMMWQVQANAAPSHWVWSLAHGDVLITEESSSSSDARPSQSILASPKTLQTLKHHQAQNKAETDPWLHADPWQPKPSNNRELSVGQAAAIEASLEQKLMQKLQTRPSEDEPMSEVDNRVTSLETKVVGNESSPVGVAASTGTAEPSHASTVGLTCRHPTADGPQDR